MFKMLSIKSSLRFASWVVLASILNVSLLHAMDDNNEEKHKNPLLQKNILGHITSFVTNSKDLESMALVNKFWNSVVKSSVQKSIQEKTKNFKEKNQLLIRRIFGREIDCGKHTHFNVSKFIDHFIEQPRKHKSLCEDLLLYPNFFNLIHHKAMMLNKFQFGLLRWHEFDYNTQLYEPLTHCIHFYEKFSHKQREILEKSHQSLLIDISSTNVSGSVYENILKALQSFSVEQMKVLGEHAEVIFTNVTNKERPIFMEKNLINLTPEEIELFAQEKEKQNNENN